MRIGGVDVDQFKTGLYEKAAMAITILAQMNNGNGLVDSKRARAANYLFAIMDWIEENPPKVVQPELKIIDRDKEDE